MMSPKANDTQQSRHVGQFDELSDQWSTQAFFNFAFKNFWILTPSPALPIQESYQYVYIFEFWWHPGNLIMISGFASGAIISFFTWSSIINYRLRLQSVIGSLVAICAWRTPPKLYFSVTNYMQSIEQNASVMTFWVRSWGPISELPLADCKM